MSAGDPPSGHVDVIYTANQLMAVQSLLQSWLVSGLATGSLAKQVCTHICQGSMRFLVSQHLLTPGVLLLLQVLLPASARLNAHLSQQQNACFQAVQAHLSFSTCAGSRQQYDRSCSRQQHDRSCSSSSSKAQAGPCTPAASATLMAHPQRLPISAASWQCTEAQRR